MIANKVNLKKCAKQLLGVDYTPEQEKVLIDMCTKNSPYLIHREYQHIDKHMSASVYDYMSQIDKIVHGYGVESLYPDINLTYVNMGDTYALTLYWYNGKLHIGCWGDIAENHYNKLS